ncbi:MAG: oligopeptide:H+ symporter, partial [Xanthomonadaceae bacterium]|nr:oligopeptide:H+ symporter [Xanthomonadaceae bacterium]
MNSAMPTVSKTRSFSTVFLIEMWERFGYYGMQALIVYYMVQRLGFEDDRANLVWSAAAALIYVAPAIGGWIGDKYLGTRRTMLFGAVVLAIGYALMTVPSEDTWTLFGALGVIVVGNGLFKPNAANLVRKIYEGDDAKIDSAFTMYYMAVNIGATASQLATPLIAVKFGWHLAFAVSAGGLIVGILNYLVMRRYLQHVGSEPDFKPLNVARLIQVLVGIVVGIVLVAFIIQDRTVARGTVVAGFVGMLVIFGVMMSRGSQRERTGLISVLILTGLGMLFFIFYQ